MTTRTNSDLIKSKSKSFFKDITPIEVILICIPFMISFISNKGISASTYDFTFVALVFTLVFGLLYMVGIRGRFIFFGILLSFAILLNFVLGRPFEYYLSCDRDSAIRVGIEAILNGEFPYYAKTDLGHTPSPLPFTFILYLPIYLITGGYTFPMNLVVIILFCILLFTKYADTDQAYLVLPIISFIIFSDYYFLETGMNSDVVNVCFILCMSLFLLPDQIQEPKLLLKFINFSPKEPKKIDKKIIFFTIIFGCLLAMRSFLWIIGIIIVLYVFKIYGLKNTLYLASITIGVFLICMLPFMLQDINYFLNVSPIAQNSLKFANWRDYDTVPTSGYIFLDFLNALFNNGSFNGIIISIIIIVISILLGLIRCENKFHLVFIIAICFLIFLFFYFWSHHYSITRDYVSIAAIPFVFSLLFINFETLRKEAPTSNNEDS